MIVTLYGIRNCDSVKKAQSWLRANNITFDFSDFKLNPPDNTTISRWAKSVGWEKLLNKQSKTFRELSPEQKVIDDEEHAIALMHQYPLLIKRPVLESEKKLLIGFSESTYNEFLL